MDTLRLARGLKITAIHLDPFGAMNFPAATFEYCSYGHLSIITGYKWDYIFYKWGFLSTYNW